MPVSRYKSEDVGREPLHQPLAFAFSKRIAQNRLLKAAMEERLAIWDDEILVNRGLPTKELIELYRWYKNGWGIIVTGNIITDYCHVAGSGDQIITPESPCFGERFESFKALATAAKAQGSLIIHWAGQPSWSSTPQFGNWTFGAPRAATEQDISRIITGFAHAAQYLEKAGFDGINLHAAHGYLVAQFLSPRTNKRTDAYGGTLTNRMRLIVEVVQEIRSRVSPSFIVSVKLNSTDFQEDGFKPHEARELVGVLQDDVGLDFVELSGGTYEHVGLEWTKESTRQREAFFLEFAEMIVPVLGAERKTKVFITGGLRSVGAMVKALDVVDGVGLARPAAQEPRLAANIIEGKVDGVIRPLAPFDTAGLGMLAAGMQMRQTAHGVEPFDMSDSEVVKTLLEMVNEMRKADENKVEDVEVVEFPDWIRNSKSYGVAE
ncbi:NADH oxidase [Mollisia scopiformis]|uniref:NADH oxidase n=1 Tax=Mollisia scopiformis TaxID=149040 RepID=A0A194XMT8_MOLSC|nr:NADH oxidase [Mollisia scopiformis]KUJ21404.1 NADH oxidase [Mollisia scopiformis]